MTLQIGLRTRVWKIPLTISWSGCQIQPIRNSDHHLSDKEFAELSQPDDQSIEAVDWISLEKVPLKKVEYMLDTSYSVYQHHDGEHLIRTEKYSLPRNLHQHIELIQPTTMSVAYKNSAPQ
ncbi:hypothetical protein PGT21_003110 [Puccinia graminis f. sp. tritici]|uniref:Peptidase S53 activation domain-containing protein n=1 Tax=Puccinia graminis f. sp. tritici TaxID=56615 RepID=A0A5B0P0N8_PUCGR|nr:hypothetical protein PGT21_003110 [Puccinia graminis f. sp. tritici]